MAALTYSRAVFDVKDTEAARRIILTPDRGQDTDERWERETPYLCDLIAEQLAPKPDALVIDYGCGIGRLSKVLIERFGCRVLGVDLSARMRALAPDYVNVQEFSVVSPHMLFSMVRSGMRADGALSVWVLQHCLAPANDIALLAASLKPDARLFVANLKGRAVPTVEGKWANDGIDVRALLTNALRPLSDGTLDPTVVTSETSSISFWETYAR